MSKHTAGPWSIGHLQRKQQRGVNNIIDWCEMPVHVGAPGVNGGQGNVVAIVHMGGPGALHNSAESLEANARLIAAAPDLLAEAKKLWALLDEIDDTGLGEETDRVFPRYEFAGLRAAIAKATGPVS